MKILFIMRHSGYIRNFESALRLLCARGHQVHVGYNSKMRNWLLYISDIGQQIAADHPGFSQGPVPIRDDGWGLLGREVRFGLDYMRYLTPEYRDAPKLRRRVERDVARPITRVALRGDATRRRLGQVLRAIDRSIPTSSAIDQFMDEQRPDLLLVTPLIEPGSPQSDYVRSAQARGIRTAFCVASWDNLTNKGVIQDHVDLVTVWNEDMKREAVELHGVAPERVAVTGAQPFDHWFEWTPSTSRQEFCARAGLGADRPYVLYLCSSKFVAPEETPFVRQWTQQLREAASPLLRDAGLLVRPHPQNAEQWRDFDATGLGNFTVYPPAGASPVDAASKADYFDSIFHSGAVVGVNTTAEIESAIIGRKVLTLLAPEFKETQEGTLHFQHLKREQGGLVQVASNFPDHHAQLEAALREAGAADPRVRQFVERFVRPFGIDVPATPRFVDAIEALAGGPAPAPRRAPAWTTVTRPLAWPIAAHLRRQVVLAAKEKEAEEAAEKERKLKVREERFKAKATRPKQKPTSAAPPPDTPVAPAQQPLGVSGVVTAFHGLRHGDRVKVVQEIAPASPPELWFELQRAHTETLDFAGARILMRVTSKAERVRLRACAKEPWTVEWIEQTIRPGDVLYDIGANVGAYSLIAAKKPDGAARVCAFEASYANIAALCANIVLNDAAAQIIPLPVALSDTSAMSVFHLLGLAPGAARHALGDGRAAEGPVVYPQPVLTFRLDDLVAQAALSPPTHIKLDVDGGELAVLGGAARTLASPRLKSVLIEVSTELSDQVSRVLESHDLRLQARVRVRNKAGEFRVWYGVFARPDAEHDLVTAAADQVVVR